MGKFITFEGGEGSGKTTHLDALAKHLRSRGYRVQTCHDPGTARIAIGVRPFLLDKSYQVSKEAEFLLYLAARAELVDKIIKPLLPHVDFVLCDRFFDSTTVYQGILRGWDGIEVNGGSFLEFMHDRFSKGIIPDWTFLFDVDPVIGLNRSKGYEKNESRWEEEGLKVHKTINSSFLTLADIYDDRFIVIDSNQEIEDVFDDLCHEFKVNVEENYAKRDE